MMSKNSLTAILPTEMTTIRCEPLFIFQIEFTVAFVAHSTIKKRCILLTDGKVVRVFKRVNEELVSKDVAMQRKKESASGRSPEAVSKVNDCGAEFSQAGATGSRFELTARPL